MKHGELCGPAKHSEMPVYLVILLTRCFPSGLAVRLVASGDNYLVAFKLHQTSKAASHVLFLQCVEIKSRFVNRLGANYQNIL